MELDLAIVISLFSFAVAIFTMLYARAQADAAKVQADAAKVQANAAKAQVDAAKAQVDAAVAQVDAAKATYRDDHEFRRREFAASLMRDWDSVTFESRSAVLSKWPQRFNGPDPIAWSDIMAERDKQLSQLNEVQIGGSKNLSSQLLITDHMAKILNYFELVAHSVRAQIADEELIKEYLRNPFFNWYNVLKEFRENMTRQRKYDPWEPLDYLYTKWYTKEKKEQQEQRIRKRTGVE